MAQNNNGNPELRHDVMSEKRKRLDSDKNVNLPVACPETEAIQKEEKGSIKPVAFSIPIENCPSSRQPPKRLCNAKRNGKASIDILNKKQALAEERRQVWIIPIIASSYLLHLFNLMKKKFSCSKLLVIINSL